MLARGRHCPFRSVRDVRAAVGHVLARVDGFSEGHLQHFFDWSFGPAPEVMLLAALVRGVGRPQEGYYLLGPFAGSAPHVSAG